jgi:hypothetical protein
MPMGVHSDGGYRSGFPGPGRRPPLLQKPQLRCARLDEAYPEYAPKQLCITMGFGIFSSAQRPSFGSTPRFGPHGGPMHLRLPAA